LPELNPVAAAFAGVAGVGPRRFVLGAAVSAAIWTSTWIGAGYLIASTTWSGESGILLFSVIVAASAIASLAVLIRPAVRVLAVVARSLRARASARSRDARLPAEHPVGSRRSPC
jgi:membrane protein DedA with SNARE-associated domain